jgi:hypothetical protein
MARRHTRGLRMAGRRDTGGQTFERSFSRMDDSWVQLEDLQMFVNGDVSGKEAAARTGPGSTYEVRHSGMIISMMTTSVGSSR